MKNILKKIMLVSGIAVFIFPVVSGLYKTSIESWKLFDWLIMYSFLYWPSYIVGVIFIVLAINKR